MKDYQSLTEKKEIYFDQLNKISFEKDNAATPEEFNRLHDLSIKLRQKIKDTNVLIASL